MNRPNASSVPSSSLAESSTRSVLRWGLTNLRRCRASVSCDSSCRVVRTAEAPTPTTNKTTATRRISECEQNRPASRRFKASISQARLLVAVPCETTTTTTTTNSVFTRGVCPLPIIRVWGRVQVMYHFGFGLGCGLGCCGNKFKNITHFLTYLAAPFPCQEKGVPPQEACSRNEVPGNAPPLRRWRCELPVAERLRCPLKLP